MSKSEIADIVIKLFGISFLMQSLQTAVELPILLLNGNSFDGEQTYYFISAPIIHFCLYFSIGLFLVLKTPTITTRLFKFSLEKNQILAFDKRGLLEIALATIALWIVLESFASVVALVVMEVYFERDPIERFTLIDSDKRQLWLHALRLIFGILVLLNARNFATKIINRGLHDDVRDNQFKDKT